MKTLPTFALEELKDIIQQQTDKIKEAGWDDVIQYKYEVTVSSASEALAHLLKQDKVMSPEDGISNLSKPVRVYGYGISLGGLIDAEGENIRTVMKARDYITNDAKLDQTIQEISGALFLGSMEEAEEIAEKYIKKSNQLLRKALRLIQVVLIPVMYQED